MRRNGESDDAVQRVPVMGVGAADVPAVLAELEAEGVEAAVFWDNDLTWGEAPAPQLWVPVGEEELARVVIEGYYGVRQEERRQQAEEARAAVVVERREDGGVDRGGVGRGGLLLAGAVVGIVVAWWVLT